MSDFIEPITFPQLLNMCPRIEIPLIQRDYAQGRESEKEVRDHFLNALHGALLLPPGSSALPLNLDFIYGSMEGGDRGTFLPLDGQQRLTTLFLLHWYTAWRDGQVAEFQRMVRSGRHSRFTYRVRPSSTEFFDELVQYVPPVMPDEVSDVGRLIQDQPWFFLHWRLDPTIQSALVMLDAIHERFKPSKGLYVRLTEESQAPITFQLLPLEHFGLTDDLYIKMNARGKPLTPFETFKARFEELLKENFANEKRRLGEEEVTFAEFFESRIDTRWTDFFWAYKDPKTHTFDGALMNLLVALIRVSLDPATLRFNEDTTLLRERRLDAGFSLFHEHGWLTREFAHNLFNLLEAWSSGENGLKAIQASARYFDEVAFFKEAIREPGGLDYPQLVRFAALVFYLGQHGADVQSEELVEWMRVVRNLSANSEIERPEEYGRCLSGVRKLLPHSAHILEYFAKVEIGQIGFSQQQIREETLKASLVLSNSDWRALIEAAEAHPYFAGQIGFLLDFSGARSGAEAKRVEEWDDLAHAQMQGAFDRYLQKAQIMFVASGLAVTRASAAPYLWKRALLSMGNYLFSIGSNYSFLTDPPSNRDSWKRFLRGTDIRKREHLKSLWDSINEKGEIESQLTQIVANASSLEPWRAAVIQHWEVIDYCGEQQIRWEEDSTEIYLLKRRQMNGAHAELFSYVLYLELAEANSRGALGSLSLQAYQSVAMTELEPRVLLSLERAGRHVKFSVESANGEFCVSVSCAELKECPEVEVRLRDVMSFSKQGERLIRLVPRDEIRSVLVQIGNGLVAPSE